MNDAELARHLIGFLDLTDLSEPCTEDAVQRLCAQAKGPMGPPAALCLWPHFVGQAQRLVGSAIPIATVVNFPAGTDDIERVLDDVDEALRDGADEIDLVLPWRAFLAGDADYAGDMIAATKERMESRLLKVILETGALPDDKAIHDASVLALEAGADFLKTSTGKIAVGATDHAARIMLDAIKAHGNRAGLKVSGGIRNFAQARLYYQMFSDMCGGPVTPSRFRIGASALFDDLVTRAKADH